MLALSVIRPSTPFTAGGGSSPTSVYVFDTPRVAVFPYPIDATRVFSHTLQFTPSASRTIPRLVHPRASRTPFLPFASMGG